MGGDRAQAIAAIARDLPPFPQIAVRIMELANDPETSAADIERLVVRDAALAARVLKISNSALYGARGNIHTISKAVAILGMKTLQSLVVAACSESVYRARAFKDKLFWEHSLSVALVTRRLARKKGYRKLEEAFIAGLLHDIGKAVMDKHLGRQYLEIMQDVYNSGDTFLEVERRKLGFDHTEVGKFVLRKWHLSPAYQAAARFHHAPDLAPTHPILCALVSLANAICVRMGIGPERRPNLDLRKGPAIRMLGWLQEDLDGLIQESAGSLPRELDLFHAA